MKTLVLSLLPEKEVLLGGFKREIRKNIRLGDKILELQYMNREEYLRLLTAFRSRKGLKTAQHFKVPHLTLFAAFKGDVPMCGQSIWFEDGKAVEMALWRSDACGYFETDWLKWRVMLFAKEKGASTYDFAGDYGYYKTKWGGVETGEDSLLDKLRKIKRRVLK